MLRSWKQPTESRVYTYDFSKLLVSTTIGSIVSAVPTARSGAAVGLITNDGQTHTGQVAQIQWGGGTDGETYATTVKVLDSAGQTHELEGEIVVFDKRFVLPTGIVSAYLDGEEYVDRFGYEETVRLTDEDRRDAIDANALRAALYDAQQFADGYLAVRYSLPIATPVPPMLQGIIADLARERLHKSRPTPAVTQAADRARSLLKDLSAGRAVLPGEDGITLDPITGSGPAWTYGMDPVVFNSDKLSRF